MHRKCISAFLLVIPPWQELQQLVASGCGTILAAAWPAEGVTALTCMSSACSYPTGLAPAGAGAVGTAVFGGTQALMVELLMSEP